MSRNDRSSNRIDRSSSRISYDNPEYPVSVIYTDLSNADLPDTRWLWHEDIKIVIINNGTAQINSDDQGLRLLPGQAVLINRNVMHSIQQFGPDSCSYYSITFHPDFILGENSTNMAHKYLDIFSSKNLRFLIFDENVEWHSELLDHLNNAIAANLIKGEGYELTTRGYLCFFWSRLVNHLKNNIDNELEDMPASLDEQRVKRAMSYIREHHVEKISLEDISSVIHVSKSECCRCFKRSIGMTPFEYLMKYRVFEAANLFKDPAHASDSIADVALAVGFNNLSYFSKLFGKYMNCTPRQYRNEAINNITIPL